MRLKVLIRLTISGVGSFLIILFTLGTLTAGEDVRLSVIIGESANQPLMVQADKVEQHSGAFDTGNKQDITQTTKIRLDDAEAEKGFPSRYLQTGGLNASRTVHSPVLPDWVKESAETGLAREPNVDVSISQLVTTQSPLGALNGERITYTVIISNNDSASFNGSVVNVLPELALIDLDLACSTPVCQIMSDTVVVTFTTVSTDGKGSLISQTKIIEIPTRIDWVVDIPPGQSAIRQFSGLVSCQRDGATLVNSVFVQNAGNSLVSTQVEVPSVGFGEISLSAQATWCSDKLDGIQDFSWGDFDFDGDLDLALGSDTGVTVYRNDLGQMTFFWRDINSPSISSLRWADFIPGNAALELIAVGDMVETGATITGENYVYKRVGSGFVVDQNLSFNSDDVLWKIEPADFDKDGDIDLAAASFINLAEPDGYNLCLVRLYENINNTGFEPQQCLSSGFSESPFWSSSETDRTSSLAWADFDNDGDLDLGVGNDNNQPNRLYRNISGTLQLEWNSSGPDGLNSTRDIAWGDFNADGTLDLAAGNYLEKNYIYSNITTTLSGSPEWSSDEADPTTSLDWNIGGADASIPVQDEGRAEYNLPFDFNYFGRVIKKIYVGTNGSIELLQAGELPCLGCAAYYNTHSSGYHETQGADMIFALSHDLYSGVIIEALDNPNRVEITWMGTTYPDAFSSTSFKGHGLLFKVTMYDDDRIRWEFFGIDYEDVYEFIDPPGDFFSGLYDAEGGEEHPTNYVPNSSDQHMSFEFNPSNNLINGPSWDDDDTRDNHISPESNEQGLSSYSLDFVFPYYGRDITGLGVSPNGIIQLLEDNETCHSEVCNNLSAFVFNVGGIQLPPQGDYVFAANDDLDAAVFIEGYSQTVHITWMGTTSLDDSFRHRELAYKVTLFEDGRVQWKFFDMNFVRATYFDIILWSGFAQDSTSPTGLFFAGQGLGLHKLYVTEPPPPANPSYARLRPQGAGLASGNEGVHNRWYQYDTDGELRKLASSWTPGQISSTQSVAWGDYDSEGSVDLAVGNNGEPNVVYRRESISELTLNPIWFSNQSDATYSVVWVDYDLDGDLDLSVGNNNQPNRIYGNTGGSLTTAPVWSAPISDATRSISWDDYDADGDPDMAVGNFNQPNYIYRNDNGNLNLVWASDESDATRSVAWGDYDADGDPDLAVGNDGQPNRLYLNRLFFNMPSSPQPQRLGRISDLAWGDYDNDGYLDLAVGGIDLQSPGGGFVHLFENDNGNLNPNSTEIDINVNSELYNLVWGDYDSDGYLDLAGSFPQAQIVKIYHNASGSNFQVLFTITTNISDTFAIDWADINSEGGLELIVGDLPPKFFKYEAGIDAFIIDSDISLATESVSSESRFVVAQGVDQDNDGDLDTAFGDFFGPVLLFSNFAPHLETSLSKKTAKFSASSVAWGDADADGDLDLLFGAGPSASITATALVIGSKLYFNENGNFPTNVDILASGAGPHRAAFGDGNSDHQLDIAIVRQSNSDDDQIYYNGSLSPGWTSSLLTSSHSIAQSLAWGDSDGDGDLDLLVGNNGLNTLYVNTGSGAAYTLKHISSEADDTRSIAWADYDKDYDLDFVVGNYGQPIRLYRNDGRNIFSLVWSSTLVMNTTSVAWGDYDADGELELAVGNYEAVNQIYESLGETQNYILTAVPAWSSASESKTTSIAWGDWDNDGDLDLAVGNDGEPDQVYANNSAINTPRFRWLWASDESRHTSDVAWGDMDGDGDLDLAISQDGEDLNGVYVNNNISPSHLTNSFARTMPLPNNPTYLSIDRPGQTDGAYFYSSSEFLSGPLTNNITVTYKVFDPDGTRDESEINPPPGDLVVKTLYEFSLNGGGQWLPATPATGSQNTVTATSRLGQDAQFIWNAPADAAISDNALFRITVIPRVQTGQAQRAAASATSPPFRVKGLTCEWPNDPSFTVMSSGDSIGINTPIWFTGTVVEGSGLLTFTWNFGDNTEPEDGQIVQHTYTMSNSYSITLTVTGEACPIGGTVFTSTVISIGVPPGVFLNRKTYLPIILKSDSGGVRSGTLARPSRVNTLQGSSDLASNTTHLFWQPNDPAEAVSEYRIYRRSRTGSGGFQLFDTVSGDVTAYTDATTGCGHMYYVTAFNARGESPPSTASYFSLPCR